MSFTETGCADCGGELEDGDCSFCQAFERAVEEADRLDGLDMLQAEMHRQNSHIESERGEATP